MNNSTANPINMRPKYGLIIAIGSGNVGRYRPTEIPTKNIPTMCEFVIFLPVYY
jgi:hypothetical protein